MKTTIELPDALFRQAAAARGVTLDQILAEALRDQLRRDAMGARSDDAEPPWMAGFGGLSDLGDDHRRVLEAIEDEFGRLDPQYCA